MSRSEYSEDCDENWAWIMWRGRVASATRGKRGQALLREMLEALDAMPNKRLIKEELATEGDVCALGCLGQKRGLDMSGLDPEDYDSVAAVFDVAAPLVREIFHENDEFSEWTREKGIQATPEGRWQHMRKWVELQIKE